MEPNFRIRFNKNKQWAEVYLWDVHPATFYSWDAGRWGYWLPTWTSPVRDKFGELHFVRGRLRVDTIYHELEHMRQEWIWANRLAWSGKTEEPFIEMLDSLAWQFLRRLRRIEPRVSRWMKTIDEL